MIILDTNVLSELMKKAPDMEVVKWADGLAYESFWITSITVMEIQYGINLLPTGKRKASLQQNFEDVLSKSFYNRIADFDSEAGKKAAMIGAKFKSVGKNVNLYDIQIVGTALMRGGVVATRNEKDFRDCGVEIINPWKS